MPRISSFPQLRQIEDHVRRIDIHIAHDTQNEATGDAEALAANRHAFKQTVEHRVEIQTIRAHMHLRIEEDLRVLDPIRVRPCEIGEHEIFEIILRLERPHQRIVEVEERLQIFELILGLELVDARPRQCNPVALGQRQCQIRFERPLDMQVQLAFRHCCERLFLCSVHHNFSFPDDRIRIPIILPSIRVHRAAAAEVHHPKQGRNRHVMETNAECG